MIPKAVAGTEATKRMPPMAAARLTTQKGKSGTSRSASR